jgi:hypothetical protein
VKIGDFQLGALRSEWLLVFSHRARAKRRDAQRRFAPRPAGRRSVARSRAPCNLPRDTAKAWLAQTIASAPTSIWSLPEANAIAARLVTLLPRRATRQAGVVNRLVSVLRGGGTGDRDF